MYRTAIVLLLSAIPVGGTVAVVLVSPDLAFAASDRRGTTLDLMLPLAVLWAIVLGWLVGRARGAVLGFIVFGGIIAGVNAVSVATMAVHTAAW